MLKKFLSGLVLWVTWIAFEVFWILIIVDLDANKIHLCAATKGIGCMIFAWLGYYIGRWWSNYVTDDKVIWWR